MESFTSLLDQDTFEELSFDGVREKNRIESHSLSGYVYNAASLKTFQCSSLMSTTEENRATLFDMTEKIFSNALSLENLTLYLTGTSGPIGRSMLQALADSDIVTLKSIDFNRNPEWFRDEEAEETTGVDLLTQVLSK